MCVSSFDISLSIGLEQAVCRWPKIVSCVFLARHEV